MARLIQNNNLRSVVPTYFTTYYKNVIVSVAVTVSGFVVLTQIYSQRLGKKLIHILTNVAKYVMEFYLSTNSVLHLVQVGSSVDLKASRRVTERFV